MSRKRIAVFFADGFEEVEAITPVDYLRRSGAEVIIAGVGTLRPKGSRGIEIAADITADKISMPLDGVVLPGGMPGAENLSKSADVKRLTVECMENGRLVGAICAAPAVALNSFGIISGRRFTCYPGFENQVNDAVFSVEKVVTDGNLITARGPGAAGFFAVELIRFLYGDSVAGKIADAVLLYIK